MFVYRQKSLCFGLVLVMLVAMLPFPQKLMAEELRVEIIINPSQHDFVLGEEEMIFLGAEANNVRNLSYEWSVQKGSGIGELIVEKGSQGAMYELPKSIRGDSAQVIIAVTATDESGQQASASVTLTIRADSAKVMEPPVSTSPPEEQEGMSMTTKVALGAGAVVALGGAAALASGGGDSGGSSNGGDSCNGVQVGGYCWYLGDFGYACSDVCASHGGYNNATRTYAGSEGTSANCQNLLTTLGAPAGDFPFDEYPEDATGCFYADAGGIYWGRGLSPTNETSWYAEVRRVCACNQ